MNKQKFTYDLLTSKYYILQTPDLYLIMLAKSKHNLKLASGAKVIIMGMNMVFDSSESGIQVAMSGSLCPPGVKCLHLRRSAQSKNKCKR